MADIKCLRIANWETHFENNRTRDLKCMTWVPVPNKLDGDGYTEIVDHKDGASHYAAWTTLVLIASRCDPRGTLLRAGSRAHDFASLSRISRLPAKLFQEAIPRLIDVGWLETVVVAMPDVVSIPHESAAIPQLSAEIPHDPALNGREGKEDKKPSISPFRKPTLEEVESYCRERENGIDPQTFVDHYEAKGWLIGKSRMKNWKAAIRTWEGKRRDESEGPRVPTAADIANDPFYGGHHG